MRELASGTRHWRASASTASTASRAAPCGRLVGGDPAETAMAVRGARAGLEMLTGGLFTDDRWLRAFTAVDGR
ncbi:hypothetical protein [Lentzea kentuckyensis]|uniref:hypothetical protein n=1 Tax=Lentzea kentuckyensis TaxID=360086 RepID=UPI001B8045BB|nr:hypothetical protein [Lentzea kentuckyensis]